MNATETPTAKEAAPTAEIIQLPIAQKDGRRAEAKYGKPVMSHGYVVLPKLLFEVQAHLKISPTAFNVLLHLVMHWWDAGEAPYPAIATIARRMSKSPRSLFRYFDELEAAGLVQRVARYKGVKAQTSSYYHLTGLAAKLKTIEPAMRKAKKFKGKRLAEAETPPKDAA